MPPLPLPSSKAPSGDGTEPCPLSPPLVVSGSFSIPSRSFNVSVLVASDPGSFRSIDSLAPALSVDFGSFVSCIPPSLRKHLHVIDCCHQHRERSTGVDSRQHVVGHYSQPRLQTFKAADRVGLPYIEQA